MKKIELLAPAKNLQYGIAAIDAGADALYIGADKFSARQAAGNSIIEIEKLINYAHQFYSKVYVAVNTIIYNNELKQVQELINLLYEIKADAIIIQDLAILNMNIPSIPIFASTQTNNYSIDRIKFIDSLLLDRIILARELSINQIKEIKKEVNADIETFIYGSLCVSLSGQCYISAASSGLSANRGECTQICRHSFDLIDKEGLMYEKDKYLLSLKDLNLENEIEDLINAGVSSFKIEGRLKDINYVANTVAYFRDKIDLAINKINIENKLNKENHYTKASNGKSYYNFKPELSRTFNRAWTKYFINDNFNNLENIKDNESKMSTFNTQKSIGKYIGELIYCSGNEIKINSNEEISPGDGLCFFDEESILQGFRVNNVKNGIILTLKNLNIKKGTKIYRNEDISFEKIIKNNPPYRKIPINININLDDNNKAIIFNAVDEAENQITIAENLKSNNYSPDNFIKTEIIEKQFKKVGNTIFEINELYINPNLKISKSIAEINQIRRELLNLLLEKRLKNYPKLQARRNIITKNESYPKMVLDYSPNINSPLSATLNISNYLAEDLYKNNLNVPEIREYNMVYSPEVSGNYDKIPLMICKYCIKRELRICPKNSKDNINNSIELFLKDKSNMYRLEFDCKNCQMKVYKCKEKNIIKNKKRGSNQEKK